MCLPSTLRRSLLALFLAASVAGAGEATCHALLVGGLPGAPVYARRYRDWLKRFHKLLTRAGVPPKNIRVLSGDKGFKEPIVTGIATVASVRRTLAEMSDAVGPADQVLLVLIGHGAVSDMSPTLILPGPDIRAEELADGLDAFDSRHQVVLNLTASAGEALKALARPGRVNVAATSPGEANEPVFAEFLLRGIETQAADGEGAPAAGKKDGAITLLEAYNWAAAQTAFWIVRQKLTERGWRVEGKESVAIFKKLCEGRPGEPAARQLARGSRPDKPDERLPLRPEDGRIDAFWRGRRVLTEHALLEDCGEEAGVCALRGAGYQPLAGREPGEPGHLARRVVLGRPALLAPEGD
ncbi:MAG: hypothetical protein ACODAJ_01020 [Planctomycetota bacterium]